MLGGKVGVSALLPWTNSYLSRSTASTTNVSYIRIFYPLFVIQSRFVLCIYVEDKEIVGNPASFFASGVYDPVNCTNLTK